jgi:hypothetical protein
VLVLRPGELRHDGESHPSTPLRTHPGKSVDVLPAPGPDGTIIAGVGDAGIVDEGDVGRNNSEAEASARLAQRWRE